jgi:hypothetical protein
MPDNHKISILIFIQEKAKEFCLNIHHPGVGDINQFFY